MKWLIELKYELLFGENYVELDKAEHSDVIVGTLHQTSPKIVLDLSHKLYTYLFPY